MYKAFVEFSTIAGCINDCKYCPQEGHIKAYKGKKMLSMEDYITMIDKLPKSCISIAGFSEPFTNPSCTDMIQYATKKGHMVIVYTTLKGINTEQYDRIRKDYGVRSIVVHLPDNEGNAKIRIDDVYKNLLRHVVQNPPGQWCSFEFSVHGSAVHSDIIDIINVQQPLYMIHDRAGNVKLDDPTIHKVHWKSGVIQCANGFGQYPEAGIIMPDGNVYLCCQDFGLKYKLGNLLTDTWTYCMSSDVRKRAAEDRLTGKHQEICRHCAEAQMAYRRF